MHDSYGRKINYLRVSLTDRCNLRCKYCMPEDGLENKLDHEDILKLEDVYKVIEAFVELGIDKVRFTGGEPLVRKGIVDLIRKVNNLENVKDIALTTNAILLEDMLEDLKDAGLTRVNISLDTMDKEKYKLITRGGDLDRVLSAIKKAQTLNINPIKINSVLIGGFNDSKEEVEKLVSLTKEGIDVRFIELMPIGEGVNFAKERFVSNEEIIHSLDNLTKVEREDKSSPAVYYKINNNKGKIGIINPISCKFCNDCNRVRLTSTGILKTCLHSDNEIDLKQYLHDKELLKKVIIEAVNKKEESHHLDTGIFIKRNMNQIGG